jgi:transcriptional regulator with XRE-family HTH domain
MKLNSAKLVTARHRKGLNQTQVAQKSGLTVTTISKAENGHDVYPITGKKICQVLNIDLAEIVVPSVEQQAGGDAA